VLNSSLYQQMIVSYGYIQHILEFTTDNRTTINHIYTNLNESRVQTGVLETYFCDHKAVCIAIKKNDGLIFLGCNDCLLYKVAFTI